MININFIDAMIGLIYLITLGLTLFSSNLLLSSIFGSIFFFEACTVLIVAHIHIVKFYTLMLIVGYIIVLILCFKFLWIVENYINVKPKQIYYCVSAVSGGFLLLFPIAVFLCSFFSYDRSFFHLTVPFTNYNALIDFINTNLGLHLKHQGSYNYFVEYSLFDGIYGKCIFIFIILVGFLGMFMLYKIKKNPKKFLKKSKEEDFDSFVTRVIVRNKAKKHSPDEKKR